MSVYRVATVRISSNHTIDRETSISLDKEVQKLDNALASQSLASVWSDYESFLNSENIVEEREVIIQKFTYARILIMNKQAEEYVPDSTFSSLLNYLLFKITA